MLSNISVEQPRAQSKVFFGPIVSRSCSFTASFVLSVPLELIYNVLCHSLSFLDNILWNNLHNSFNLQKKLYISLNHSDRGTVTVSQVCARVKVDHTARELISLVCDNHGSSLMYLVLIFDVLNLVYLNLVSGLDEINFLSPKSLLLVNTNSMNVTNLQTSIAD